MENLFKDPHEKGFIEIYPEPKPDWTLGGIFSVVVIILAFLAVAYYTTHATSEVLPAGVTEVDGVLYFPDGNPVRNYEQLYLYGKEE